MATVDVFTKQLRSFAKQLEDAVGPQALEAVVAATTELALEAVVESLSDVREHSGEYRVKPKPVVTDLVDTANLRNSFQTSYPGPFHGRVATNVEYAEPLEEGTEDMQGFFYLRSAAQKARGILKRQIERRLKQ